MVCLLAVPLVGYAAFAQAHARFWVRTCDSLANFVVVAVRPARFRINLVVKHATASGISKTCVPLDGQVVGVRDRYGTAYRYWQGRPCQVCASDSLCLYAIHAGKSTSYYFSESVCGSIPRLDWSQLRQAFAQSHPAFLAYVQHDLRWYEWYLVRNTATHTYKLCDWFRAG